MQAEIASSWWTVQRDLNWNEMIWFEARNVCAALRSFAMNQKRPIGGSGAVAPPPSEHGRDFPPANFGSLREHAEQENKATGPPLISFFSCTTCYLSRLIPAS